MLPFYIRENDPPAKREILRAAMKLFSQHGLAATTIRDIAKEIGRSEGAVKQLQFRALQSLRDRLGDHNG